MPSAVPVDTMQSSAPAAAETAATPTLEDSSRVFVKNLPPNITEDQLRKHFSAGGRHITDVKLIARRRIAFVGYRSPDEARGAVRYFHRSYVRLSKLAVELAKPISDPSLPTAHKMKRLHEMHAPVTPTSSEKASSDKTANEEEQPANNKKRKRDDLDAATNPKLREYLEVMQPQTGRGLSSTADVFASIGDGMRTEDNAAAAEEDEAAAAAALVGAAEAESDDEYESIPARPSKKAKPPIDEDETMREGTEGDKRPARVAAITATAIEEVDDAEADASSNLAPAPPIPVPQQPRVDASATDDDWLRSRTNRLLDLMDPDELAPPTQTQPQVPRVEVVDRSNNKEEDDIHDTHDHNNEDNDEKADQDKKMSTAAVASPVPNQPMSAEDQIRKTSRLFVRNLPYDATEAHLREYFAAFGNVSEVSLPVTNSGANKGYAMVLFADPEVALAAFHNADGKTFQGRILHVLPAKAKKTAGTAAELDEFALAKLPLKQQRLLRKKAEAATSTFSWNSLFMSQDAVNAAVAERLGVSKSAVLDPTSSDEAVKQAIRQTSIIEETKDYFANNGVDLEAFQPNTKRGDTCILVKHFAYGTPSQELRKLFEEYGPVVRVLMPPSGTIAIVQFAQPAHGRLAYSKLAYRKINDTVLMLEKCPENLLGNSTIDGVLPAEKQTGKQKLSASDLLEGKQGDEAADTALPAGATSSVFVRNLNFATTTEQLAAAFRTLDGFVAARVKTRPDPKKPGQQLSMGYGFVEFRTREQAQRACQERDGHVLQGHTLTVRESHRGAPGDAAEAQREADRARKLAANSGSKLIVKNVPFEASRKDLLTLLGTYGQVKSVRMPKKFGALTTRGYAFAEFASPREAANAMASLRNTHLLGRRLVFEFAAAEAVDAEEELAQMQRKTGAQAHAVEVRQLTQGRSQRAKVHIGEEAEEA